MKHFLSTLLLFLYGASFGITLCYSSEKPIVLKYTLDEPIQQSEAALLSTRSEITFTQNTNLHCGAQKRALLGKFTLPQSKLPKFTHETLQQIALRSGAKSQVIPTLKKAGSTEKSSFPMHLPKFFVGEKQIPNDSTYATYFISILKKTCDLNPKKTKGDFISIELVKTPEGMKVKFTDQKKKETLKPLSEFKCQPETSLLEKTQHYLCVIPNWGINYLSIP